MKLSYIFHSGFAIEFPDFSIIIDYCEDSDESGRDGIIYNDILKRKKPLYVLSTHSHPDHFVPEILGWKEHKSNIIYIFSKDILTNGKTREEDATYLDKLDVFSDKNMTIRAYGSTDIGISFLIRIGEKTIFHAGDFNNWHWDEESTPEEIQEAEDLYQRELSIFSEDVKHLDLAIFPIDPRLGVNFLKGAEQFIEAIKVDVLAPMHFSSNPNMIDVFQPIADSHNCKYINWKHRGESIII